MSSKWLLAALAVVVVIGGGMWWSGMLGGTSNQGAAVATNSATSPSSGDPVLKDSLAKIDVQITALNASVNALGSGPTRAQISTAAANITSTIALMSALNDKMRNRSINAKASGSAVPSAQIFTDVSVQLSNAGSQASTANKNASVASPTAATISTSVSQLKTAQVDIVAARASLKSIFTTLKIN